MYHEELNLFQYPDEPFQRQSFEIESKEVCQQVMDELPPMQIIMFDLVTGSNCGSLFVNM